MSVNSLYTQATGQIAMAFAITALASILTLSLLYAGIPIFGPINDLTNAVGGVFSTILAWQFHALLRERSPGAAAIFLLAAWGGSAAIIVNSVLVAFDQMHWMTGGMYTAIGYGLLGIWLLGLIRLTGPLSILSPGLIRLGTIAAVAMLFGLLAGPLLAARVSLENNSLVWGAYIGAAAGWLLFPVWCWLVGQRLISA
jgi:hypothetical protein